jgi:hypothetical protein
VSISKFYYLKYNVVNNKMHDKTDIRHIQLGIKTVACVFKLPQKTIDYLWERIDIGIKEQKCHKNNIPVKTTQYDIDDPQQLIISSLYDILYNPVDNPNMFEFINTELGSTYKRIHFKNNNIQPYLTGLWVNFQKKGEFQPIHAHGGMFSFVIWMDIPYNSKDEAKYTGKTNESYVPGGCFSFAISDGTNRSVRESLIKMSPEMNGYCCFFPSDLSHQVYPFYTSDKDRISISGNIMYR